MLLIKSNLIALADGKVKIEQHCLPNLTPNVRHGSDILHRFSIIKEMQVGPLKAAIRTLRVERSRCCDKADVFARVSKDGRLAANGICDQWRCTVRQPG